MDWREAHGVRLTRWVAVLTFVSALHVAGAAYSVLWRGDPDDDDPEGVFVVELAPVTTSAHTITHAVMPGPESTDSIEARPAALQEKAVEEPILDLPPLPPLPDVPEDLVPPERVVEKPPEKKPEEELPRQKEVVTASQASVAAQPLKVEDAAPAAKTAAPVLGVAERDARTKAKWQRELVAHLGRFKSYPTAARDRREAGQIMLRFVLDRSGRVTDASVARTSGHGRLDAAALDMVKRASPLPQPPDAVPGATIELVVPVRFQLKD